MLNSVEQTKIADRPVRGVAARVLRGLLARPLSRVAGTQLAGWLPKVASERQYRVLLEADIEVTLPDGTVLRGDLYRPDAPGAFPGLVAWSCYTKELQNTGIPLPINEVGAVGDLVARGYCHLTVNARGSGQSDGEFGGLFSPQEQRDVADAIEWLAAQSWCDGNVGMIGMSYFAIIQYLAAAQRPPHLRAIFPYLGLTDLYRHATYHGGAGQDEFLSYYFSFAGSTQQLRVSPAVRHALSRVLDRAWFQWFCKKVFLRLEGPGGLSYLHPEEPWMRHLADLLFDQREDSSFYRDRSAWPVLDQIEVPVLLGTNWGNPGLHMSGAFEAWRTITAPKLLFIGPPETRWPWQNYQLELLAWYDHHLKGLDTGIDALAPVRYWLAGADTWREATDWPIPEAEKLRLHLVASNDDPRREHRLSEVAPVERHELSFLAIPRGMFSPPALERFETQVLRYATAPFDANTEIIGPVTLHLRLAATALDTDIVARVSDIPASGEGRRSLSFGCLRASHRSIDPDRSGENEIVHDHTAAVSLVPGEQFDLDLSLTPLANLFRSGHRLVLEIASRSEFLGATMAEDILHYSHVGPPYPSRNTVIHGPASAWLDVSVRRD